LCDFPSERSAAIGLERAAAGPGFFGLIRNFMQTLAAKFPHGFSLIRRHFVTLQTDGFTNAEVSSICVLFAIFR
jgi:hypothetical protein